MRKILRFNLFTLPAFCSLLLFLLPLALAAQEAPVSVSFTPPDGWEQGDVIEMIIDYGSEDHELRNLTEVAFLIEMPEGVSISGSSELEVYAPNSWFAHDNYWEGSAEIANNGTAVTVSLVRTNGTPASGYGEVARVKGLSVVIEEIILKTGLNASIEVSKQLALTHLIDSRDGLILAEDAPQGAILEVYNSQGQLLRTSLASDGLDLQELGNQILFVKLTTNGQYLDHKAMFVVSQ